MHMSELVEEIQLNIDQARGVVALGESLDRLFQNPDFREVIVEGYFRDEAVRLVELKAAPQMAKPQYQEPILKAIDAIGALQQHFNKIRLMADQARQAIEDSEQELESLAAEGEL
jgi:hypothetical protein